MIEREFETDFAKKLFCEVSALIDVNKIKRRYISEKYIWKLWKRVYRENRGVTRFFVLPKDL